MKVCSCCNIEKNEEEFYNKQTQCKDCVKEKRKIRENKKKGIEDSLNVVDFSDYSNNSESKAENENNFLDSFGNELVIGMFSDSLKALFSVVAIRAGEHWKINDNDSMSIARPIVNMISKSALYSKLLENADIVSLFTALGVVIVPRVIKTVKNEKNVKREEIIKDGSKNTKQKSGNEKTETKTVNREYDNIDEIALDDYIYSENII